MVPPPPTLAQYRHLLVLPGLGAGEWFPHWAVCAAQLGIKWCRAHHLALHFIALYNYMQTRKRKICVCVRSSTLSHCTVIGTANCLLQFAHRHYWTSLSWQRGASAMLYFGCCWDNHSAKTHTLKLESRGTVVIPECLHMEIKESACTSDQRFDLQVFLA